MWRILGMVRARVRGRNRGCGRGRSRGRPPGFSGRVHMVARIGLSIVQPTQLRNGGELEIFPRDRFEI